MHHVVPLRNSPIVDERRRHSRHKPTSIVYVALGPGNGGILVNLSAGGMSLQAVAKLNADTELDLNFRLQGTEQAIEAVGCVAWLDSTHKEAGLSFKKLPASTEQQIAKWIQGQEQAVRNAPTEEKPHTVSAATGEPLRAGEPPRLPSQASIPAVFPSEKPESARPSFIPGILSDPPSELRQRDDFESAFDTMPPPPSAPPAMHFRTRPEERFESPTKGPIELSAKHYELSIEPQALLPVEPEILPRDCLLPQSISSPPAIVAADLLAPAVPDPSATDLHRRRKFAIALAAGVMGILALIVMATSITRRSLHPVPGVSDAPTAPRALPPAAKPPEEVSQTKPKAPAERPIRTTASSTASVDVDATAPVPVVRVAVAPAPHDNGFIERLRELLGLDVATTIDPAAAALPVWTVRHSGFYYCAHSPAFRTLEPGAIMTQGQALQSGYQPKLGSYCE
ncbi:MAG TPA: PilZ domain-containing protein [Verrucomicrobiae bacterium]|nr:PilZ domain-containing protein [Verrucomicrobiae bacterium]